MRVFNRKWSSLKEIALLYEAGCMIDGTSVMDYVGEGLDYRCSLCRRTYGHWLCDDHVWGALPAVLHKEHVCKQCFVAVRALGRLEYKHARRNPERLPLPEDDE